MEEINISNSMLITIKSNTTDLLNNFNENLKISPTIIKSMNVGKILENINLKSEYKRFALLNFGEQYLGYCEKSPYWLGCSFGHYMAISMAKNNNWPYVIIFEDDVVFTRDIVKNMQLRWETLPDDFDTFVFGYDVKNMLKFQPFPKSFNNLVYYGDGFKYCGAHSYIVNACAYDKMLNLLDNMYVADVAINNPTLKCFYSKTSLCNQPQFIL